MPVDSKPDHQINRKLILFSKTLGIMLRLEPPKVRKGIPPKVRDGEPLSLGNGTPLRLGNGISPEIREGVTK